MGGNIMVYRYPLRIWTDEGFGVFLLNPPGHGKSDGTFNFQNTRDLLTSEIAKLTEKFGSEIPFVGIGHSGGGSTLLRFFDSNKETNLKKIFLLSPILNTALSLHYLYKNNKIDEFTNSLRLKNREILNILSNEKWMEKNFWDNANLKAKINRLATKDSAIKLELGTFLENIFIPTKTFYDCFNNLSEKSEILLPSEDIWFPIKDSVDTATKFNFPFHIIENAKDHFFRNAWKDVSSHISKSLEILF